MFCPKCSAENDDDSVECWQCGASLAGGDQAPPADAGEGPPPAPASTQPRRRPEALGGGAKAGIVVASILLPLAGLIWGLVLLSSGGREKRTWGTVGVVASIVIMLGWGLGIAVGMSAVRNRAQDEATKHTCGANVRFLALGMLMYAGDHQNVLPDASNWETAISSYVRNDDAFVCPSGGKYAMNPALSGVSLMNIPYPAETVLLYEVDDSGQPVKDVHDGGANYAFADGHGRWFSAEDAPDL